MFGVCLGLQGMIEAYGGKLAVADAPTHGKPDRVVVTDAESWSLRGLSSPFVAAR